MQQPQIPKRPSRMSEVPVENRKPSVLIELLVWIAFIIPIVLLWMAFQSVIMVGVVIAVRILIMGISHYDRVKKATTAKAPKVSHDASSDTTRIQLPISIPTSTLLSSFIEEATSEIMWLLEKMGMYNHSEESRLQTYRRFRGWE